VGLNQYDWQREVIVALDMLVMAKNMAPDSMEWRYFFDEEVMKRTDPYYIAE
jgi:hypothetical protein